MTSGTGRDTDAGDTGAGHTGAGHTGAGDTGAGDAGGPGAPTLVGDRYELGPVIGYGGMAEVHRGLDTRLGRTVAIKLLRASLAQDETFQERFRREATASASLNHPCIISVYDTGDGATSTGPARGLPYIVMEFVEGRTLRDVLREGRRILPERALEITAGTLSALDYSHRMGIVHRDIKPANVMLTPSGEVKVMDFGIARAVEDTSTSVTQTAAVIGTAQYLSPEQARGELVGPGGDIYSVGVVLYELLVGRPPFTGSSPVALALAHVRDIPEAPAVVDPEVPAAASAIAMCALAKSPGDRYPGALAMREDIERALAGRPVWAASTPAGRAGTGGDAARGPVPAGWPVPAGADDPTGLFGPGTGWAQAGDVEETGYTAPPTQLSPGVLAGAAAGGVAGAGAAGGGAAGTAGATPLGGGGGGVGGTGPGDGPGGSPPDGTRTRRGALIAVIAVLVVLVIAGVIAGAYKLASRPSQMTDTNSPAPTVSVSPPVTPTPTPTPTPTRASASPTPSATPSVSPSAAVVRVPDTTGRTVQEATRELTAVGLAVGAQSPRADATVGTGRVISQSPGAGASAAPGDTVDLVVSTGPGPVVIGDVSGQQLDAATRQLRAAGLVVRAVAVPSSSQQGVVLETDPPAGRTVDAGSTVTIRYASGRNQVPDTTGRTSADATSTLVAAGFTVTVEPRPSGTGTAGVVVDQSPRSGSAPVGSRVVLYVTSTPSPTPTPTAVPSPPTTPSPTARASFSTAPPSSSAGPTPA